MLKDVGKPSPHKGFGFPTHFYFIRVFNITLLPTINNVAVVVIYVFGLYSVIIYNFNGLIELVVYRFIRHCIQAVNLFFVFRATAFAKYNVGNFLAVNDLFNNSFNIT